MPQMDTRELAFSLIEESPAPEQQRDAKRDAERRQRRSRHMRIVGRKAGSLSARLICCVLILAAALTVISPLGAVYGGVMEVGDTPRLDMFLRQVEADTAFGPGIEDIDTTKLGTYEIQLTHKGITYTLPLTVQDTVPPTAEGKAVTLIKGMSLKLADCVQNIQDATDVVVTWAREPDTQKVGEQTAVARITDAGNNHTDVSIPITVIADTQAPVIEGTHDIDAFLGESISYREGVTVTDDLDERPALAIDSSAVNLAAEGAYPVTYTATDASGNSASVTVTVTLTVKPLHYEEEQEVYALAQPVYDKIIDDDMTDMEKAFAIYWWVEDHINYVDQKDHSSWINGAYQAFTKHYGDCFTYYAAAKALLNMAGIDNLDVVKSDTSHSAHFWLLINLGFGWYHFDACPRQGSGDKFFMVTDAELEAYSSRNNNSHIFDHSLYPERATQSVQDMVSYSSRKIRQSDA